MTLMKRNSKGNKTKKYQQLMCELLYFNSTMKSRNNLCENPAKAFLP